MTSEPELLSHAAHWGAFRARRTPDGRLEVHPHELDPDPYPLIQNITDVLDHPSRVDRPYARRGWLEGAPRTGDRRRGRDTYVPLSWDEAEELLAAELRRVYDDHGPTAVFGGSYGWSSAGRFHHAQSQVHRFLNTLGGYTRSVNSYSLAAAEVLLPHVTGSGAGSPLQRNSTWSDLVGNCELMVCFGGLPTKNSAVSAGGVTRHLARAGIRDLAAAGCAFVNVSPLGHDLVDAPVERWIAPRPGTDVALMLALCHELVRTGRADSAFLERYTTGHERFLDYVTGGSDGVPKTAAWAAELCDVEADDIVWLARIMAERRTMVTVAPALQRAEHGEQPVWAGIALACLLGGVGRPGEGYGMGFAAMGAVGNGHMRLRLPSLPQGRNPVDSFIPVARISDMLLGPGSTYDYNGERRVYPEIRLVYWAGGNPFHHHQDLFRLADAFQRPDTVVVHESFWTATARHADLVLPATVTAERVDFGAANNDDVLVAMHRLAEPYGQARDDYDIFAALSRRLGVEQAFTEGRSSEEWVRYLFDRWREDMAGLGHEAPDFDTFWATGTAAAPLDPRPHSWLDYYRADPDGARLTTPSGRIELFSATIDSFGYDDSPGHPAWVEPEEWLGGELAQRYPLQLVANQPATRLHSQLDMGRTSREAKRDGREVLSMHPSDAAARGLADGDIVRVRSDRGAFLASLRLVPTIRPQVVQIPTGAWFDADVEARLCVHGNPNAVTLDRGTSRLAQGSIGQLCLVEVERYDGPLPPIRCYTPPVDDR